MSTAPHPSDEDLSALLDGEADHAVDVHVESCTSCGQRVEALRQVIVAVATPVSPVAAEVRTQHVAYAIAAAAEVPVEPDRPVVALPKRARRDRRPPAWLLPAAAAVAALLLAVPLLASLGGGGGGSKKSASAVSEQTTTSAPSERFAT